MKQITAIIFLFFFIKSYSQKIEKRIGAIHIIEKEYYFDDESNPKKRKIGKSEYYFNDNGQILEKIGYSSPHAFDLSKIGRIEQFSYANNLLNTSKNYSIYCDSNSYRVLHSKYDYNEKRNLISENTYYENDSLFMSTTYAYFPNREETHSNESIYYEKVFDKANRLIEFNQRHEDTKAIRWQYLYKYFNNTTVGSFQTFYNDKNDHSKIEIKTYDDQKRLTQFEEIHYGKTKKEYTYSKEGFIKEIKEYELNSNGEYKLKRLKKFKAQINSNYPKQLSLQKIHHEIIEE